MYNIRNSDSTAIIREAKAKDIEDMTDLLEELFFIESDFAADSEKQAKGLKQLMESPAAKIWVAEIGDKVIGMCTLQLLISTAEGGPVGMLEDIIVNKKYRRRTIGHQLLFAVRQYAAEKSLLRLQLLADSGNTPALDFYYKENWEKTNLIALRKKPL